MTMVEKKLSSPLVIIEIVRTQWNENIHNHLSRKSVNLCSISPNKLLKSDMIDKQVSHIIIVGSNRYVLGMQIPMFMHYHVSQRSTHLIVPTESPRNRPSTDCRPAQSCFEYLHIISNPIHPLGNPLNCG